MQLNLTDQKDSDIFMNILRLKIAYVYLKISRYEALKYRVSYALELMGVIFNWAFRNLLLFKN